MVPGYLPVNAETQLKIPIPADDFVIGFEDKGDAERVMDALGKRLDHFGLTLHPDKTRLLPLAEPSASSKMPTGQGDSFQPLHEVSRR
jgi:hypothetical protein